MKRLGIDLGSNSLGWAILSDSRIEDCGVVVFEEGISRTKGVDTLETPAAKRRKYRMARRLKFRRRLRKMHVLKILVEYASPHTDTHTHKALPPNYIFRKEKSASFKILYPPLIS